MTPQDLALALVRTTLVTSVAACVAGALLAWLKIDSPRTHRIAWLLVVAQGWLLIPWTLEVESLPQPPKPAIVTWPALPPTHFTASGEVIASASPSAPAPRWRLEDFASPAVAAWLVGGASLAFFAAYRYVRIVHTLPRGEAPDDPQWQREWRRARRHAFARSAPGSAGGLPAQRKTSHPSTPGQSPGLSSAKRTSPRIDFRLTTNLGPLVAFIPWRYLLLAPRPLWSALTPSERTAILRHELAHIRRRDLAKSLAFRILALPQWFNPLVWLAARRFDDAAEWHCDREAANVSLSLWEGAPSTDDSKSSERRWRRSRSDGVREPHDPVLNPTTIATALLRTAEFASLKRPPRTLGFLAAIPTPNRRTALTRRIQRLVTPRFKEESTMKRLAIPALLALVAAAQLIRIEHVAADTPPPSKGGARGGTHDVASDNPAQSLSPISTSTGSRNQVDGPAPPLGDLPDPYAAPFRIGKDDVLSISLDRYIPQNVAKLRLEPQDQVNVLVHGIDEPPIAEAFRMGAKGEVAFGAILGTVNLAGLTLAEAQQRLQHHFQKFGADAEVEVSFHNQAQPPINSGLYTVKSDGTIDMPPLGALPIVGLTFREAEAAITTALAAKHSFAIANIKVAMHDCSSQYVFLVEKSPAYPDGIHTVMALPYPLTRATTIGRVLKNREIRETDAKRRPLNFAVDRVAIQRPTGRGGRQRRTLTVVGDLLTEQPTAETNFPLLPGDMIEIDATGRAATAPRALADTGAAPPAPAAYNQTPPTQPPAAATPASAVTLVPPPSAETQAIRKELEAARDAGDHDREARAFFRLPYVIEPPDVLDIKLDTGKIGPAAKAIDSQQITGQRLVSIDGRINLGNFGSVFVAGFTTSQAREAIEAHLDNQLAVLVDVAASNSKVYYIITKDDELGDDVVRAPITGNETVLDAIANVGGLAQADSVKLWIARPAPHGVSSEQILKINWSDVASGASIETNYRLMPGDRLFIDKMVERNTAPSVQIEYAWTSDSGLRKSRGRSGINKSDTVAKLMTRMLSREHRLHDSMLDQCIGIPEVFSGAEILIRRPTDSGRSYEQRWRSRWDDTTGRIVAGDDVELQAGDKLFVKLLDVKISAPPIPDGDPWVEIDVLAVEGSRETTQRARFNRGLTIAQAVAAMSPPPAVDFAKATIVHCRPQPGSGDLTQAKFLTIEWEGQDAPNKNLELETQDFIRIDPAGRPFAPPLPAASLPLPLANTAANAAYDPATPANPAAPAAASAPQYFYPPPYGPAPVPMPAIPGEGQPRLRAAVAPSKPSVSYLVVWDEGGGKRTRGAREELQPADTVGSFMKRLVERGNLPTINAQKFDLSTANVYLKREGTGPNSTQSWVVRWDQATGLPAKGEDRVIEANDAIIVGLMGVEPGTNDAVAVVLKLKDGRESRQHVPFRLGVNVGDIVAAAILPPHESFGKARVTLFKRDGSQVSDGVLLPIAWEAGKPTKETNYAVTAGSMLTIDFNTESSQPPSPADAVVERPLAYPQGSMSTPGPPAHASDTIDYKFALLEDTSGDLPEFVDADRPGMVHATQALQPALRVLTKHKLITTLSEPYIRTRLGRPAQFAINAKDNPVPYADRDQNRIQEVTVVGQLAEGAAAPGTLDVKIDAYADHAGKRHTLDATFTIAPGQSAIARLRVPDGGDSPFYLMVTPEWPNSSRPARGAAADGRPPIPSPFAY